VLRLLLRLQQRLQGQVLLVVILRHHRQAMLPRIRDAVGFWNERVF
jgi:hypothetical protein